MEEYIKVQKFLLKHRIHASDIMYVQRDGKKSVMHMKDGRTVQTFHPLKNIVDALPPETLVTINKGIAIAPGHTASVEENVYTMSDGTVFNGRLHALREHQAIAQACQERPKTNEWDFNDFCFNMPYALCIIELIFDSSNRGLDFIFRYCNKAMEELEGKTLDEMLNKSFYDVFDNADPKWLLAYADIAANGGSVVLESYSPEVDANLRIYCFQPRPNYCACILVKLSTGTHAVRQLA